MIEFKLTVDEAIEVLRNEVVYPLAQDNTEEGQMKNAKRDLALRMAIEALEREPIPDDCEILTKEAYSDLCLRVARAEQKEIVDDGTLVVNTANYDKVKRVLVQQGTSGSLFYPEEDIPADIETAYARGYNNAKREIALSGEYERAFQRGYNKAKAEITLEQAINRLYELGWLQEHDRILAESNGHCEFVNLPPYAKEECEDCISREQALIDIVNNTHLDGYDLSEALNVIENMPSVKPKANDMEDDLK